LSSWGVELFMLHLLLEATGLPSDPVTLVTTLVAMNLAVIVPLSPANLGTLEAGAGAALVARGAGASRELRFALPSHPLPVTPVGVVAAVVYTPRGPLGPTATRSAPAGQ